MKGKINKVFSIVLLLVAFLTIKIPNLYASSGSMSVRSSRSSVVVGNTFDVTVTVSSGEALGGWGYTIQYDSSKLKLVSGETPVAGVGDGIKKSASYTYRFKSIAKGTSTISLSNISGYAWSAKNANETMSFSAGSVRISAITQAELEASYSKNNNLSSLGVTGYTLSPEFNKDTLEYTVKVPSDVEKITLEGAVEDTKASISGLGEFDVSEGENKFDIVVTAENGGQKTYVVKVNVEDENPIETTIDGLTYTVVKRASTLSAPTTFEATTQMINGVEVPAFKSSITNFVLVGLKTKEGTPNLYIYNEENNTYTLYRELKTEGTLIFPTKAKVIPDNYKKVNITINGEEVEAYEYNDTESKGIIKKLNAATNTDGFYLIYGINIETGEETFFQYDAKLNTISRYNKALIDSLTIENKNFLLIIIVLSVETVVLLLILLIAFVRRNKTKKRRKKKNDFNFEEFEEKQKETKLEEQKTKNKIDIKEETKTQKKTETNEENKPEDKKKEEKEEKKEA